MKKQAYTKPGTSVTAMRGDMSLAAGSPLTGQTDKGPNIGHGGKDEEGREGQAKYKRYNVWEDDY